MDEFIPVQPSQTRAGPSGTSQPDPDEMYKRKFGLEPGVPADPLDEIILGVRMGTVDISEEGDEVCMSFVGLFVDEPSRSDYITLFQVLPTKTGRGDNHKEAGAGGSEAGTDDEDLDIENANGKAMRAIARRQAFSKKKEVSQFLLKVGSGVDTSAVGPGRRPMGRTKPSKITTARLVMMDRMKTSL